MPERLLQKRLHHVVSVIRDRDFTLAATYMPSFLTILYFTTLISEYDLNKANKYITNIGNARYIFYCNTHFTELTCK